MNRVLTGQIVIGLSFLAAASLSFIAALDVIVSSPNYEPMLREARLFVALSIVCCAVGILPRPRKVSWILSFAVLILVDAFVIVELVNRS